MSITLNLLIIFISLIALVKGAGLFTNSVSPLARKLGLSTYTISFFLVAIGTSLPELVVAVNAGLNESSLLSFGDAMGSNIALLALVAPISIFAGKGISTKTITFNKDLYLAVLIALIPLALSLDGRITRLDGALLLGVYVFYATVTLRKAKGIEKIKDHLEHIDTLKQFLIFFIAMFILIGSSHLVVQSALNLSITLGVSLGFIGATVTAFGTSLPEIAFEISSVKKDKKDQGLGGLLGSVVANSTLVLGTASVLHPIDLNGANMVGPLLFFVLLSLLVFLRFSKTKDYLNRKEGLLLLGMYIAFIITGFWLQMGH